MPVCSGLSVLNILNPRDPPQATLPGLLTSVCANTIQLANIEAHLFAAGNIIEVLPW